MVKITHEELFGMSPEQLFETRSNLLTDQSKLNTFFDAYLKKYNRALDESDEKEWWVYREMLSEYERVDELIQTTNFHLLK